MDLTKLDEIEAHHTNISRDGDALTYCVGCERGPWPCREKRLAKALRIALEGLKCHYPRESCASVRRLRCAFCAARAAALSALDEA
jgi:hypothetical protein